MRLALATTRTLRQLSRSSSRCMLTHVAAAAPLDHAVTKAPLHAKVHPSTSDLVRLRCSAATKLAMRWAANQACTDSASGPTSALRAELAGTDEVGSQGLHRTVRGHTKSLCIAVVCVRATLFAGRRCKLELDRQAHQLDVPMRVAQPPEQRKHFCYELSHKC